MRVFVRFSAKKRQSIGIILIAIGQALIVWHHPPESDYYFPIIWYGYILALDGFLGRRGEPAVSSSPRAMLLMLPVSAGIWWLFEAFNLVVNNWKYVGGAEFLGWSHVLFASVCFSTVLLAVWETALYVDSGMDRLRTTLGLRASSAVRAERNQFGRSVPLPLLFASMALGIAAIILPVLYPRYAFGMIWLSLFFLLDPINCLLGRASILQQIWEGRFRVPLAFAIAGPICGFFWEFWNYWATVKWVYTIPNIPHWHLFAMPLPGYLGYIPFGLELYAMGVLLIPFAARLFGADAPVLPLAARLPARPNRRAVAMGSSVPAAD